MNFEKLNTIAKVHHYKKKGYPNTKISRMVGLHRNTVSAYLKKNPEDSIPWLESQETRSKKLDPFAVNPSILIDAKRPIHSKSN